MIETVIVALWIVIPAYVPNSLAVIAGGGRPVDSGIEIGESRALGDGKTWRGSVVGTVGGIFIAIVLNEIVPIMRDSGFDVEPFTLQVAFGLAFGAMLGDMCASFLKRRTGRSRGSSFMILDQIDFLIGSLFVSFMLDSDWVTGALSLELLVVILVVTPVIHVLTNIIGYRIGLKNEPY